MLPESDFIAQTVADVQHLAEEWGDADVSEDVLRRSSPVVRRLLVDGDLARAWRLAGLGQLPTITSYGLDNIIKFLPLDKIRFASAGGATIKGVMLGSIVLMDGLMTPEQMKASSTPGVKETLRLDKFIEAPSIIVQGKVISRQVVVKFIANTQGGAHSDLGANKDESLELLRSVQQGLRLGPNVNRSVYHELLSIGQQLFAPALLDRLAAAVVKKPEGRRPA